ncbi:hypothetical protein Pla52n_44510 [Stieleria varia]|uniref:Uncharacterized protein n=1 Tax=Stieleria varia TaxID=2528005 RepID=A0A5C6AN38_9BACT|nr:hypothetical protein Pla52n_44510 [Stieleria varia]
MDHLKKIESLEWTVLSDCQAVASRLVSGTLDPNMISMPPDDWPSLTPRHAACKVIHRFARVRPEDETRLFTTAAYLPKLANCMRFLWLGECHKIEFASF